MSDGARVRRAARAGLVALVAVVGVSAFAAFAGAAAGQPVQLSQLSFPTGGETGTLAPGPWTALNGGCSATPANAGTVVGAFQVVQGDGDGAQASLSWGNGAVTLTGPVRAGPNETLKLDLIYYNGSLDEEVTLTGSGTSFTGGGSIGLGGCTWTTVATLTLTGSGLTLENGATTTTAATTPPVAAGDLAAPGTNLGGLDVAAYCQATTNSASGLLKGAITGTNFAYDNWECTAVAKPLSMQKVCQWTYGTRAAYVIARAADSGNAYSWQCYAAAAPASAGSSVKAGDVAPIASTISTPGEIFHSWGHNFVNAIITVGVILFIAFPAMIFNQTFSENYGEILLMAARARRRLRRLVGLGDSTKDAAPSPEGAEGPAPGTASATPAGWTPDRASRPWFAATLVVGAILGGLLSPAFGANAKTVEDVLATLVAFAFGAVVSWYVAVRFRHWHKYPTGTYLRALPVGLVVAVMCVLVSRLTHFEPGYLYGVVAGIGFVESMKDRHNAHLVAISSLSTLAVAVAAWLVWVPINHLALEHSHEVVLVIVDDVLGSIFVGGLVGTVIGLLPLEGLPGGHLTKWRRDVWAGVFFVAVFLLIEVELRPASGPTHPGGAPVATAIILFVAFGALSFGTREYFRRRKRRAAPAVSESTQPR